MGDAIRKVMERFPAFAWIVVIVGAFWAVWTYQTTAWIDARKPFLEKQLLFCIETVQTVAKVATTTNAKAFEQALEVARAMPGRPMVGLHTLDVAIQVRILAGQPRPG